MTASEQNTAVRSESQWWRRPPVTFLSSADQRLSSARGKTWEGFFFAFPLTHLHIFSRLKWTDRADSDAVCTS